MNYITFAIATILSIALYQTKLDFIALFVAIAWGTHLYGAHEYITDEFHEAYADNILAIAGVLLALFLGLVVGHFLIAMMGAAAVATAMWLRRAIPQHFPQFA